MVKRRTIAKGAAWTIPVIAIAAAAPAASASAVACPDIPVSLSAVSLIWNDGANGFNRDETHDNEAVYYAERSLLTDYRLINNGPAVIASLQIAWNIQEPTIDQSTVTIQAILPDGTTIKATALQAHGPDPTSPGRVNWIWLFDKLTWAPGETYNFRVSYKTSASTGGQYVEASPFANAAVVTTRCPDGSTRNDWTSPDDPSDNSAIIPNPYEVKA